MKKTRTMWTFWKVSCRPRKRVVIWFELKVLGVRSAMEVMREVLC